MAIVGPLPDRLIVAKVFGTEAQALADGRLFAAAPDLLATLTELLAADEEWQQMGGESAKGGACAVRVSQAVRACRAAVAKAEGG